MSRYALVRDADARVVNVIELEDPARWTPPALHTVIADTVPATARIGGLWDGAAFLDPPAAPDRLTPKQRAAVDRLTAFISHDAGTTGADVDAYLAAAPAAITPAMTVAAVKLLLRNDRAYATLVRMLIAEVHEEE